MHSKFCNEPTDHLCAELHHWANSLRSHAFPFGCKNIPADGIYILFEVGETAHEGPRIVRVGTHTGKRQLPSRLQQHFMTENKDRSIFRKNIGRAILKRDQDSFLENGWEIDLTTAVAKARFAGAIDPKKLAETEKRVTTYMQSAFTFVVIPVEAKEQRLRLESRIISTVSRCALCRPSPTWLGNHSPKEKICESGLWLVNELYKDPLTKQGFQELVELASTRRAG
jgi:hypothetical protein